MHGGLVVAPAAVSARAGGAFVSRPVQGASGAPAATRSWSTSGSGLRLGLQQPLAAAFALLGARAAYRKAALQRRATVVIAPPKSVVALPKYGGAKTQAFLTAIVAGIAVFGLCVMNEFADKMFGLTLWIPPFGAMALLFASQATAAAQQGTALKPAELTTKLVAVIGSVVLTVALVQGFEVLGSGQAGMYADSIRRTAAVVGAAILMSFIPHGAFFGPTGGLCTAYTDQALRRGWLETPYYLFAVFPCAFGMTWLLLSTHFLAAGAAFLLRKRLALTGLSTSR